MRIACPTCNAAYEVPDGQLHAGRVVRCVRCGTDWAPVVPGEQAEPVAAPMAAPVTAAVADEVALPEAEAAAGPVPERVAAPAMALETWSPVGAETVPATMPAVPDRRQRASPLLAVAWVASVVAVLAAVALLYVERERVMAAWPPSVRGYAALGLAKR